jgi:hypothetical protein
MGRGILLWLLGVSIPTIILLAPLLALRRKSVTAFLFELEHFLQSLTSCDVAPLLGPLNAGL